MVIKKNRIPFIFFGFIITVILNRCTCNKGILGCADTSYSFNLNVKAYPDADIIKLGDTLWLEINSPTEFEDLFSNKVVDYGGAANLGSAIGFGEYIGKDSVTEAANFFSYKLISGENINNSHEAKIREYLFIEQNNRYLFKLGIIPKQKGVFGIGFSNAANVYREDNKCTKASFVIAFKNTRQHYYLNPNIDSSVDTTFPGASYYFKVY